MVLFPKWFRPNRRNSSVTPGRRSWPKGFPLRLETLEDRTLLSLSPLGNEFRVNASITGSQNLEAGAQSLAADADGNFLVAFQGQGPTTSAGIFVQRLSVDGMSLGQPVQANSTATAVATHASVAADAQGRSVVVWHELIRQPKRDVSRVVARWSGDSAGPGSEVIVRSVSPTVPLDPVVAMTASGQTLVVWTGPGPGDSNDVYGRRYGPDGVPLGDMFRVNRTTTGVQDQARVAALPGGGFVVAWHSAGRGIFLQRFDDAGHKLGGETRVSQRRSGEQEMPALAVDSAGAIVVAWSGTGSGDGQGIFLQHFAANGKRLGSETRVNATIVGRQVGPALAISPDGELLATWASKSKDGSGWNILGQHFAPDGTPDGAELVINATLAGQQRHSGAAFGEADTALVVWNGAGADDPNGVFARRIRAEDSDEGDVDPPVVTVGLANDTGLSATDRITSDGTIRGSVTDAGRIVALLARLDAAPSAPLVDITVNLGADGQYSLDRARLEAIRGGSLADGPHVFEVQARDEAGNTSSLSTFSFTLDTMPPAAPTFGLSPASDTGTLGDQITEAARVMLVGSSDPLAQLTLVESSQTATASAAGAFRIPDVVLAEGANQLRIRVTDLAGNVGETSRAFTRVGQVTDADAVLTWNGIALEATRQDAATPPMASRALAMVSLAMFDAINSIEQTPAYAVSLAAPAGASPIAAVASAAHRVLSYLYPAQQTMFDATLSQTLGQVPDGQGETDGLALGRSIADTVIALRSGDGWNDFVNYVPSSEPGAWQPTTPMYDVALLPQWATLAPFTMTAPDEFRPAGPPALDSEAYAAALADVQSLGRATGSSRTAEQLQIARFWADGPGTVTPPGHWNQIAMQIAQTQGNSLSANARLFAQLNLGLADAAIVAWDAKFAYEFWRPVTAIQNADADGNPQTEPDDAWTPLLITPPFPEYVSGHSTFSGAAAAILSAVFGDQVSFTIGSPGLPNVTRSFISFDAAAEEAGRSRIYGGIHYQFSNADGLAAGRALAGHVLDTFAVSTDTQPPRILLDTPDHVVSAANVTVRGRVVDNVSGVAQLEAQLDNGPFAPLTLNANGTFSLTTALALDGSADGPHVLRFRTTDAAGNVSAPVEVSLTLDTRAPTLTIDAPTAGDNLEVGAFLTGRADGTGSPISSLTYRFDSGSIIPILFSSTTGLFDESLDLSRLLAGAHTLTVTAQDAAGNVSTVQRQLNLAAPIPFEVTKVAPSAGAVEVGSTFKPQVFFTRPVDPASLNADNFYATRPDGTKLSARIVPANDGSFAWLFFADPMPSAARITLHVDGSSIRSAGDGLLLDADGDGTGGGQFTSTFSTVSLTPLPGTTLSGKVVDPGPDLKPMTFDDFRAGPDQILHTADDVFLRPIAGVKIWILGLENQAVFTDVAGNFHFDAVPAGNVKLAIDGRTATNAPDGLYFPEMVMDLNLQVGAANTVMGTMGTREEMAANRDRLEVYLPRLQTTLLHDVSGDQPVTIGVDAASAPNLTPEQRALLSIEVQPGSLIDAQGNPVASGQVGISTVPPELVRDMLPPGVLQHTFDITIQTDGITNFATPATMTFPNVFDAAPGEKLNFLSFDHTTGRLVIEGTATVSADGLSVTTDPGNGITHPGWHGVTPRGAPAGPNGPPPDPPLVCQLDPPPGPAAAAAMPEDCGCGHDEVGIQAPSCPIPIYEVPVAIPLITREKSDVLNIDELRWTRPATGSLTVKIEVDGPLASFMKKTGNLALVPKQQFTLTAQGAVKSLAMKAASKTYLEMFGPGGFARLDRDQLYGAKIQVTETLSQPGKDTTIRVKTIFLYRWITAVFAPETQLRTFDGFPNNRQGITAAFMKTLNDGTGGWDSQKPVNMRLPAGVTTLLSQPSPVFQVTPKVSGASTQFWKFDPTFAGPVHEDLAVRVLDEKLNTHLGQDILSDLGTLKLRGTGIDPVNININLEGYKQELRAMLTEPGRRLELAWGLGADYGAPGVTQSTVYQFGPRDPNLIPRAVRPMSIPLRVGQSTEIVTAFIFDPNGVFGGPSNDPYSNVVSPSQRFQTEFAQFLPGSRLDPGPDRIFGTADDEFTSTQLIQLEAFLNQKAAELLAAVKADFAPADANHNAFRFVTTGGDVTVQWADTFTAADGHDVNGTNRSGKPIYGYSDSHDADQFQDGFNGGVGDSIVMEPILKDAGTPQIAKQWVLAEELNTRVSHAVNVGVAIHMKYEGTANLAGYVANTVSHEVGHGFGLLDAYLNRPFHLGGTARVRADGDAIPYDIMRRGYKTDKDLAFAPGNVSILQAAMGLADYGDLAKAVLQYRRTFNLPKSNMGLKEDSDRASPQPLLFVTDNQQVWYGDDLDPTLELGESPANGQAKLTPIRLFNAGLTPLDITALRFADPQGPFHVEDPNGALLNPLEPNTGLEILVGFDPAQPGAFTNFLEIVSNDPELPVFRMAVHAGAFAETPRAQIDLVNSNNLGSALVDGDVAITNEVFRITNVGNQPLRLSNFRLPEGDGAFRLLGIPSDTATQPVVLARGESFTFGARFDGVRLGLARALIEVTTNDPTQPKLRLSVSGTGVELTPKGAWGKDYIALATPDQPGSTPLRVRSDDYGSFQLFLPPEEFYELNVFDPATGLIGRETGITAPTGGITSLATTLVFEASAAPDSDYDGLPDDIEFAIGTSINRMDSDGNGLDDFVEIQQGLDPFGGRAFPTGIVARIPLQGEARKIIVEGARPGSTVELAYLATGSNGLAIVDVTNFAAPILVAEMDLPGDAVDVAYEPELQMAVVASSLGGLHLIDVADPQSPRLIRTLDTEQPATQVKVKDGAAFVVTGADVRSYDLKLGVQIEKVYAGGVIGGMAAEGPFLYTTAAGNLLTIIEFDGPFLTRRGQVRLTPLSPDMAYDGSLFVGGGTAYVMNTKQVTTSNVFAGGFATVDVTNPDLPRLISLADLDVDRQLSAAVAANGSGLALAVGGNLAMPPRLDIYDVTDPRDTARVVRSVLLPSFRNQSDATEKFAIMTAAGAAFVTGVYANDSLFGGLFVVNYLPFDVDGQAPDVTVSIRGSNSFSEIPVQFEGRPVHVNVAIREDVQVRSVELFTWEPGPNNEDLNDLGNYDLVRTDVSFPFDLSFIAPSTEAGAVAVRVRVTDTGGNVTVSSPQILGVNPDNQPPVYFPRNLTEGFVRSAGLTELPLAFSEALNPATITAANFQILDAQGQVVPGLTVERSGGSRLVIVRFDALPVGSYKLVINAANVTDRAGNPVGSDPIVTNFQTVNATTNFWIGTRPNETQGNWHEARNWSRGVPGPSDDVQIDLPPDYVLRVSTNVTIRSLHMRSGILSQSGGTTFTYSEASEVSDLFIGGQFIAAGDLTVTNHLSAGGTLASSGEIYIAPSATMELPGGLLDGGTISVAGRLIGKAGAFQQFRRSPKIEIQQGATFEVQNGFYLNTVAWEYWNAGNGEIGQVNLFGRFTVQEGASIRMGLYLNVLPGGSFEMPESGRVQLEGGGRFGEDLTVPTNAVLQLRGPTRASLSPPTYYLPDKPLQLDGTLSIGGARVIMTQDCQARVVEFEGDFLFTPLQRNPYLSVSGTLTVTERMSNNQDPAANPGPPLIEGRGQIIILPEAQLAPITFTFRGPTIRVLGELYFPASLQLGEGTVLEIEGTWHGPTLPGGGNEENYGSIFPGTLNPQLDQSLDQGVINVRVPMVFTGGSPFIYVPINFFESVELRNATLDSYPFVIPPTLELGAGATFSKPVHLDPGSKLWLLNRQRGFASNDPRGYQNRYTIADTSGIDGPGNVWVFASDLILNANLNVAELNAGDGVSISLPELPDHVISGTGNIDVSQRLDWSGIHIVGPRNFTVAAGAAINILGSRFVGSRNPVLDGLTLVNRGTGLVHEFTLINGATLRNEGSVVFQGTVFAGTGDGVIENYGTAANDVFFGADIQVPFVNFGTLQAFTSGPTGAVTFRVAALDNAGLLIVARHRDLNNFHVVTVTGDFVQRASGTFRTEIAYDYFGEAESGSLFVNGQATLAGSLEVKYVRNIYGNDPAAPRVGDAWPIVSAGTLSGDFDQLLDLDPADGVGLEQVLNGTSLQVRAQ